MVEGGAGFSGFELSRVDVGGGVELRVRRGGSGPGLLLLHGYPQTHLMWLRIAPALAERFTVVAPDLRGYGESSKPASTPDHAAHSKRAMAADGVALMRELGFDSFQVVGHDRGGRVGYRMALDHPARGAPAVRAGHRAHRRGVGARRPVLRPDLLALVVPGPAGAAARDPHRRRPGLLLPRRAVRRGPARVPAGGRAGLPARAWRTRRSCTPCARTTAPAPASTASSTSDDRAAGATISCPTQVLWGTEGALPAWYDPLEVWRAWAPGAVGSAVAGGHFFPEENPDDTLAALRDFHVPD